MSADIGVVGNIVRPVTFVWRLLKVQRSVVSSFDEWPVTTTAVTGLQNLTGCSQPGADFRGVDDRNAIAVTGGSDVNSRCEHMAVVWASASSRAEWPFSEAVRTVLRFCQMKSSKRALAQSMKSSAAPCSLPTVPLHSITTRLRIA